MTRSEYCKWSTRPSAAARSAASSLPKLSELAVVRHVAAKDRPAIFVDNERALGQVRSSGEFCRPAVDDNAKLDILQSLQVAA
jgi:hypothetical protein